MNKNLYHKPVLLFESIDALVVNRDGVYADFTFGGGGHSRELLNRLSNKAKLFAFDKDENAQENIINDPRFTFIRCDYRFAYNFLRYYNAIPLDGIIADLGLSSHHIDDSKRGFSFRFADAELDMRMDVNTKKNARFIINNYSLEQLVEIFNQYGEINNSFKLAKAIVAQREQSEILLSSDLLSIAEPFAIKGRENQYYAKLFQALRIEVNDELLSLKELLLQLPEILKPSARAVFISYHSLEDRLVKNLFKTGNIEGKLNKDFYGKIISPWASSSSKVITPNENEIKDNNRARSAKLRIAIKN